MNKESGKALLTLVAFVIFGLLVAYNNVAEGAINPFKDKSFNDVMNESGGRFVAPQEAVQTLPIEVGETKVEFNRQDVNLLSQEQNKTILEFVDTKEKIPLTCTETGIVIECGGTTLILDSSVDIGKIVVDKDGVKVYDKDNNIIAFINKNGGGYSKIDGMYVTFDKGAKVNLSGQPDGKISAIEVVTAAGSYKVERLGLVVCKDPGGCGPVDNKLLITTPGGDTFYFDPKDFGTRFLEVKNDGSATLTIAFPNSTGNQIISIDFDTNGKATKLFLHDSKGQDHEISLGRDGACMWGQCNPVELNFRVNDDSSVTIGSDAGNAVRLNVTADGNVEAIKPDGTVVPIEGDVKSATFHENGQLSLYFNDGTSIVINPGTNPNDPKLPEGWKDWTPQQRAGWLAKEIISGDKARIDNALAIFGSLNTEDQAKIISALIPTIYPFILTDNATENILPRPNYSNVISQLFKSLGHDQQVGLLRELTKDAYNTSGSLFYRPNAAVYVLKLLDAPTRNALFVDLAKVDIVAAAKILINWRGGFVIGPIGPITFPALEGDAIVEGSLKELVDLDKLSLVNPEVMDMFKALLGADSGKAGALLGELLKDAKGGTKLAANIFNGLTVEDQVKIIGSLIPANNPDPSADGYKVMNKLFQALSYDKQLKLLGALSKDNDCPTAAVHILQNLDAATRNKLFVDLAKADPLAGSRIIANMETATAAKIINELDVGLAADLLNKLDSQKVVEILTAIDPGDPNYDAHLDLNGDGIINLADAELFRGKIGTKKGDSNYDAHLDLNGDGYITIGDVLMLRGHIDAHRGSNTPIISAGKAGQILAAMDKGKAADVLEAMKPQQTIPIIRAMLSSQGVQAVADIMKLMAPDKVAAIMALPNWSWPIWTNKPVVGTGTETFLPNPMGLTVKECVDILKAMGGLKAKEVGQIMKNLFKLNPYKAIQVWWALRGIKIPIPWPKPLPRPFPLPRPK